MSFNFKPIIRQENIFTREYEEKERTCKSARKHGETTTSMASKTDAQATWIVADNTVGNSQYRILFGPSESDHSTFSLFGSFITLAKLELEAHKGSRRRQRGCFIQPACNCYWDNVWFEVQSSR